MYMAQQTPMTATSKLEDVAPMVCHPIEMECDACELNEEWSAYYGEEIWLCAN
jgi:hypothetical protein